MECAGRVSKDEKRRKRMKLIAYAAVFAVFQTVVILVFSLTVMRVKNPKFRLVYITFEDLTLAKNSSSFNMKLNAEVAVKNTNFGHFKFDNTTIMFEYEGVRVGEAFITNGKAKARSTKKMNVTVGLNSDNIPGSLSLRSEISSGFLTLTSHTRLSGKVQLMKLIKKKKSAQMNCTIMVDLVSRKIQDIKCQ